MERKSKDKDKSYMNEKFENQKETLVSIKHEISLLYQQVNYLIRNEKPLELLDLDVLMNRTHTLYDQLCSINLGEGVDGEDLPFDAEAFSGLFGSMTAEESAPEEAPAASEPEPQPEPQPEPEPELQPEPEPVYEPEPIQEQPAMEEQPVDEELPVDEEQPFKEVVSDSHEEEKDEKPLGDEFGFFFRFEDIPEKEVHADEDQPLVSPEGKLVHVMEEIPEEDIPERDRVHGDDLVMDNPLVMPRMDEERKAEREEIERQATGGMMGFFEQDDAGFELSTGETLGEKMMGEDHSLAAKLQQNPVLDLKSSIGINDKFLFVNELFGGSMEKYNKSIDNLNDLKTLNGAMIYLNELKIELQWNSSNEAYQKLKDLVSHKFE